MNQIREKTEKCVVELRCHGKVFLVFKLSFLPLLKKKTKGQNTPKIRKEFYQQAVQWELLLEKKSTLCFAGPYS